MASLSLPRVLQPRKTSLEIEREQFEKAQTIAIHKAISKEETPVKQKHVRSAIIGTFHHQGAEVFWAIAVRLPYMEEVIVAWKFCYVLHKILREGHPLCVIHSQKHKSLISEIGKLWGHLDGYGKLIQQYTSLLRTKLEFHKRNEKFPSNLAVTTEELMAICRDNADICFQLSVEIFDYLDAILELQTSIYNSPASSMTMQGQCRLAAIIPCIQDASRLYDHNVKILYSLHSMVDYDVLEGHRIRFSKQYKGLKKFYESTNNMQYFKNLISIPPLVKEPNFKANFNTYVTQEVYIPQEIEQEDDIIEVNLIDTSDNFDTVDTVPPIPPKSSAVVVDPQPNFDLIVERDNIIKSLHQDVDRLRREVTHLSAEREKEQQTYKAQVTNLQSQLATREEELIREKEHANTIISGQEDDKAKEEKIRTQYLKIRNEHVDLLREKAKIEKNLKTAEKSLAETNAKTKSIEEELDTAQKKIDSLEIKLRAAQETSTKLESLQLDNQGREKEIEDLKLQLDETINQRNTLTKELEAASLAKNALTESHDELSKNLTTKLESLQLDIQGREKEIEGLKLQLDDAVNERNTLTKELEATSLAKTALTESYDELFKKLTDKSQELDKCKLSSINNINTIIQSCINSNIQIVKHAIEEIDNPAFSALICSPDYLHSMSTICEEHLTAIGTIKSEHLSEHPTEAITVIIKLAHTHAMYILQGRATSNTCPDISFGEKMAESCKTLGNCIVKLLETVQNRQDIAPAVASAKNQLVNVRNLTDELNVYVRGHTSENLESMLEAEMQAMDKAIEDAVKQMEEMLSKSRVHHSGVKLQVNERIIDKCSTLMAAIRVLVQKSRLLQAEIVAQGKGTASTKEFYKRNHQWTDGFISAAKAVGASAKFLLSVADKAVDTDGKLEPLVVAAQNISGSTAQLVVASRVKADRHSSNLKELSSASKDVTNATAAIVATVKDCGKLIDETIEIDTSNISLHNSKRLEMDSQVRVLELEKELENERLRLAQLRKHHYQLEEEAEKRLNADGV